MKSIKEKAKEMYPILTGELQIYNEKFVEGANYVLEEIENYMKGLDLGKSAEEKFYKLDLIADLGLYIKELKGE